METVTTFPKKTYKPLPPATGSVKWAGWMPNGNPLLRITVQTKTGIVSELYEVGHAEKGWNLYKVDEVNPKVYHIRHYHGKHYSCDCPDAMSRPERKCQCKHVRGLLKAIESQPL
jgi:hypothetical protein